MQGNPENEVVFYAKMTDFTGLSSADYSEEHEQVETRLLNGDKIRIRKTTKDGQTSYEFTAKQKNKSVATEDDTTDGSSSEDQEDKPEEKEEILPPEPGETPAAPLVQTSVEYSAPCSPEMFEAFKAVAEQTMVKTRYYFGKQSVTLKVGGNAQPITVDNVGYEVDVFKTNGEPCLWVKVDLEVDGLKKALAENHKEITSYRLLVKASNLPFKPEEIIFPPVADDAKKAIVEKLWREVFTQSIRQATAA